MSYSEVIEHVRAVLSKINTVILEYDGWFDFTTDSSDGRRNSMASEPIVANYLLNHPSLTGLLVKKEEKSKNKKTTTADDISCVNENNRAFGDIGIDISRFGFADAFPCNIKIISEDNKAGNNSCGLIHLIGYTFQKPCNNHDNVMEILIALDKKGYSETVPLLYGIIMVMKEKKQCWVGTFDEVPAKCIGTNPSNPLQIPFLTEKVKRTNQEYIAMLIQKIVEYHEKKSHPYIIWKKYQDSKREA